MSFPTAQELRARMNKAGLAATRRIYGTEYNPRSGEFEPAGRRSKYRAEGAPACCGVGAASLHLPLGGARTGGDEWTDAVAQHYGVTITWLEGYMAGFDGEPLRFGADPSVRADGYETGQRHASELGL